MTRITLQNGQIVLRDGKIGTEQACCCKKCEGPCDEENPCPEGCACVDGECVDGGEAPCDNCPCLSFTLNGRDVTAFAECEPPDCGIPPGGTLTYWGTGWVPGCFMVGVQTETSLKRVIICISGCGEDGEWILNDVLSDAVEGPGVNLQWSWPNARITKDENGCPNGIDLGERVETGDGGITPIEPVFGFQPCPEENPFE
jgi:hypothetical protein